MTRDNYAFVFLPQNRLGASCGPTLQVIEYSKSECHKVMQKLRCSSIPSLRRI